MQRVLKLKDVKMDLKSTYSLLQLQNAIVKNAMFNELDKKQNNMRIEFLQNSKDASEEEKEWLLVKLNQDLEEISNLEVEWIGELWLRIIVDPNEKMFLSLDDINHLSNILWENFVLIDKSNDLQLAI